MIEGDFRRGEREEREREREREKGEESLFIASASAAPPPHSCTLIGLNVTHVGTEGTSSSCLWKVKILPFSNEIRTTFS